MQLAIGSALNNRFAELHRQRAGDAAQSPSTRYPID